MSKTQKSLENGKFVVMSFARGRTIIFRSVDESGNGVFPVSDDGKFYYFDEKNDTCTVRRWGTSKGIGELCYGPTQDTTLDALQNTIRIPVEEEHECILTKKMADEEWEARIRKANIALLKSKKIN